MEGIIKSPEEILESFETFNKIVDRYLTGDKKSKVVSMVEDLGERICTSPASGRSFQPGCYAGGFLDYSLLTVKAAFKLTSLFESLGGKVNFSQEELAFTSLFCNLGLIGDKELNNYIPQTNQYRVETLQEKYTNNPDLDFMLIPDRSLFLLQSYEIPTTKAEWLAIKLSRGNQDDSTRPYFAAIRPETCLKSNLVSIITSAVSLVSRIK